MMFFTLVYFQFKKKKKQNRFRLYYIIIVYYDVVIKYNIYTKVYSITLTRLKLRRRTRGCWAGGDDTLLYGPIRESSVAEPDGRRPARRYRGKRETGSR
jgi:hypothetical protein